MAMAKKIILYVIIAAAIAFIPTKVIAASNGSFAITVAVVSITQYQLTTSVTPSIAGRVSPDCSGGWLGMRAGQQ